MRGRPAVRSGLLPVVTNWAAIIDADFAIPAGASLPALTSELVAGLGEPDPGLRDEQVYPVLSSWVLAGQLDDGLTALGEQLTGLLGDPRIQARTFAALMLAVLVNRDTAAGVVDAATVLGWRDAFAGWWLAETDLRGWDSELGWLHAAAHGADLAGELGLSPRLGAADLTALLGLASARLLAPTGHVFAHQEDDRIALALAVVLGRPELTEQAATRWLEPVREFFDAGPEFPPPAHAVNTARTLRCLYLMADRGIQPDPDEGATYQLPHRRAILAALGAILHLAFPPQL